MNNVASSWKTTVVGLASAGLYAWANAGNMDAKHIAVAVLMQQRFNLLRSATKEPRQENKICPILSTR